MRTKQEVVIHLANNGYSKIAKQRILGFLLGIDMINKDEILCFLSGQMDFNYFYEWFKQEKKDEKECECCCGRCKEKEKVKVKVKEKELEKMVKEMIFLDALNNFLQRDF